jgi:hypothetical protein
MSNTKITSPLVSVQWLAEHLDAENLVILDASMQPITPVEQDSAQEESICIKGARRFDFDNDIRKMGCSAIQRMYFRHFQTRALPYWMQGQMGDLKELNLNRAQVSGLDICQTPLICRMQMSLWMVLHYPQKNWTLFIQNFSTVHLVN